MTAFLFWLGIYAIAAGAVGYVAWRLCCVAAWADRMLDDEPESMK